MAQQVHQNDDPVANRENLIERHQIATGNRDDGGGQRVPIQLSWNDVTIKTVPRGGCCSRADPNAQPKVILDGVSGCVKPGQFLSIIGASGAGKTTLLNYLSGRLISQNLSKEGNVLVNGQDRDQIRGFSAFSAYVQQDDILFQTMSVRECLEFAAKLKLPGSLQSKLVRVERIIQELRLTKCQGTKIGGPLIKGVSGGERKRTSIGVELITDPSLIFLDEPTTGLDSFTATSVMETLRDLAANGRTIIQTIHQPNSDIFEMMDQLMLLAKGKIIYFNQANKAVDYFAQLNYRCPELSNPSDYFMSIMSIETIEQERQEQLAQSGNANAGAGLKSVAEEYAERITFFSNNYHQSALYNDPKALADVPRISAEQSASINSQNASWCYQFQLLAQRNFLNLTRLPQTSYVKLIVTILTALFCIVLFFQVGGDRAGVQNRQGALFFITMTMSFNAIQNVILIFPDERPVFLREANNNMYKVSAYFWAKIFSELPSSILTPVVFGSIVYYAIGFSTIEWYKFPMFLLILFLIYNASGGYSLIIGTLFSDKQLAVTLTPVLIIPFMLFAGFFVNQDNIPVYLIEFQYLSIFKYGYQALFLNEFEGLTHEQLSCLGNEDPQKSCDPINEFKSPQDLDVSIYCLIGMYVACYAISLCIMLSLSRKYE